MAEGKETSRQAGRQGHQPAKGHQRRLGFIWRTLLAYHNPAGILVMGVRPPLQPALQVLPDGAAELPIVIIFT